MRSAVTLLIAGAWCTPLLAQDSSRAGPLAQSPPQTLYRKPTTARTLGILVPGGGHVYAGEYLRGFLYYERTVASVGAGVLVYNLDRCITRLFDVDCDPGDPWAFRAAGILLVGLGAVSWVASVIDAPRAAERANERHRERQASAAPYLHVGGDPPTVRAGLRVAW
jgi:hypothetical protein